MTLNTGCLTVCLCGCEVYKAQRLRTYDLMALYKFDCYYFSYRSRELTAKQIIKVGRLKVRVVVSPKRLAQQDGVESPQSDRESLKEELRLLTIGRDRNDFVVRIVLNCAADSLIGPKVSKAICWNVLMNYYFFCPPAQSRGREN